MSFRSCALRSLRSSKPLDLRRTLATGLYNGPLLVLGLESSADDTCASVVSSDRRILSNVVLKQSQIHETYGGIHPLHAQEAHQRNMPFAIRQALEEAKLTLDDLDAIAFTRGPGMYGCLSVCAGAAKALAGATGKPLIGVHHMQAHALTPFLTASPHSSSPAPEFPFLTLLLSGGHTLLLLARSETSFEILATTHDESIGASFDKAARDLEISWELGKGSPGAALEAFAFSRPQRAETSEEGGGQEQGMASNGTETLIETDFKVPFPKQLAFSYAGLRSNLTRILTKHPPATLSIDQRRHLAREFMSSAIKQVESKVQLGIEYLRREKGIEVKGLVVSGGVASNLVLRERLRTKLDSLSLSSTPLLFPPVHLCTDNAAMIAWVGISRLLRGGGNRIDPLDVMQKSKWSIEECESDFEGKS